jgi:hypothetical protein
LLQNQKRKRKLGLDPDEKIPRKRHVELSVCALVSFACLELTLRPKRIPSVQSKYASPIWTLPNELLIKIVMLVGRRDILALSQVCQHLSVVASPIYMAKSGLSVTADDSVMVMGGSYSALSVWRRSQDFRPLKSLWCNFSDDINELHRQAAHLKSFLRTCPRISSVTFTVYKAIPFPVANTSPADFDMTTLLCLVSDLRFTGCTVLRLLGSISHAFVTGRQPPKALNEFTLPSHIDHLDLEWNVLFSPVLQQTAFSMISNSSLTTLRLHKLKLVNWATLLPKLSCPALQQLMINSGISVSSLHRFLVRHHKISDLRIRLEETSHKHSHSSSTRLHLPMLEYLEGPPHYIYSLLKSVTQPPPVKTLVLDFDNMSAKYGALMLKIMDRIFHNQLLTLEINVHSDIVG